MSEIANLTALANSVGSDKGTTAYCAHAYTRVYEAFLGPAQTTPLNVAEIGLMHVFTQAEHADRLAEKACPSLSMWAEYLPQATINGFDIVDFSAQSTPRIRVRQGDQGNRTDLKNFAQECGPFDIIIDDGSHASHHQQITLGTLFPYLRPGGIYIIEDLHFQPKELEISGITPTREFLRGLRHGQRGSRVALTQAEFSILVQGLREIRFFDSASPKWPLIRLEDALAVLVKRGEHTFLPASW